MKTQNTHICRLLNVPKITRFLGRPNRPKICVWGTKFNFKDWAIKACFVLNLLPQSPHSYSNLPGKWILSTCIAARLFARKSWGQKRGECIETFIVYFSRESFDVLRFETAHGAHPPPGCHWELQIYPFSKNTKISVKKSTEFSDQNILSYLRKPQLLKIS